MQLRRLANEAPSTGRHDQRYKLECFGASVVGAVVDEIETTGKSEVRGLGSFKVVRRAQGGTLVVFRPCVQLKRRLKRKN